MDGTTINAVKVDVALQGGGAHGAFTWGVLDRLLADETIDITAISGASAGAMNAVVAASGLAIGGREGARRSLTSFWEAVNKGARQLAPFIALFDEFPKWTSATASWLNLLSGAQLSLTPHPSNGRPAQMLLEEIVRDHVDFDALKRAHAPRIFISATNARSGAARIFRNDDVTLDAIIASACLPLAFPAVEIDGEDYWDGGYSANPPLVQLVQESLNNDLVLVTVNPISRTRTPSSPDKIPDRISELTFNQTLTKDIRAIAMLKAELDGRPPVCGVPFIQSIANLRLHEIQNELAMREFDPKSKMFPSWALLTDLHSLGSETAEAWLGANRGSLGVTSTAQLEERYL
ncbi:MAG: patatin-like phospholipase family protein [Pseudomonadota bacterium]|nr:patatin-like phospholipase family protein [Pseudomonadota bacterium]